MKVSTSIAWCFIFLILFGLNFSANAELLDREGGLIYDSDLNITWLQDANFAYTSGYDLDGRMYWNEAITWADNLAYAGYDNWRRPSGLNNDGSECLGYCPGSEIGHLYFTELGHPKDKTSGLINSGPFTNIKNDYLTGEVYLYWTSTPGYPVPIGAVTFRFSTGYQSNSTYKYDTHYAWAVHDGDIGLSIVPEPMSYILFIAGVTVFAGRKYVRRRNEDYSYLI